MVGNGLDWYDVLIAAASGFVIGGLWYGPVFGKPWQRLVGLSDEDIADANMFLIFGSTFVLNCVMALVLGLLMEVLVSAEDGIAIGAGLGLLIGAAFVAPTFAINYLFARKPAALYGIDVGYMCLLLTVMGAILSFLT